MRNFIYYSVVLQPFKTRFKQLNLKCLCLTTAVCPTCPRENLAWCVRTGCGTAFLKGCDQVCPGPSNHLSFSCSCRFSSGWQSMWVAAAVQLVASGCCFLILPLLWLVSRSRGRM